ncbi:uncharacterized protein VTP21DRAFT_6424 [Calcarisporiella thermophila]|uniref:uncharacterized protein n=1 Tax=Calcarisporiella thermophila TaxID=911321 RepID=UPI0037429E4F
MAEPSVICLVRALYDYRSSDPSALNFRKGSIIEVLGQLQSGWWDGVVNGERGWFPSNYVEVIDEAEDDPEYSYIQPNDVHLADDNMDDAWVAQTTPDGVVFYFNARTGESTWELPVAAGNRNFSNGHSQSQRMPSRGKSSPSSPRPTSHDTITTHNDISNSHASYQANQWVARHTPDGNICYFNKLTQEIRWSPPDEEIDIERSSSAQKQLYHQQQYQSQHSEVLEDSRTLGLPEERLPPNWERKQTPQGKTYYYNTITEETTWNLSSLEEAKRASSRSSLADENGTHPLATRSPSVTHLQQPSPVPSETRRPKRAQLTNEPVTWSKLASNIALAIHACSQSARNLDKPNLIPSSTTVVESIRQMLAAAGCLDKEAVLRSDRELSVKHRAIMASLSKLVLSSKMASSMWPPPDAVVKMQKDANDVLVAVRNFVAYAQEIGIEVQNTEPRFLERSEGGSGAAPSTDLVGQLEQHSKMVSKAHSLLVGHVNKMLEQLLPPPAPQHPLSTTPTVSPPARSTLQQRTQGLLGKTPSLSILSTMLIAQTRQWITQLGMFVSTAEEVEATHPEFLHAKQVVYNESALAILASQAATDSAQVTPETLREIIAAAERVEVSIRQVIEALKAVAVESGHHSKKERDGQRGSKGYSATGLKRISELKKENGVHKGRERRDEFDADELQYMDMYESTEGGRISTDSEVSMGGGEGVPTYFGDESSKGVGEGGGEEHEDDAWSLAGSDDSFTFGAGQRSPRDKVIKFFGEDPVGAVKRAAKEERKEERPWFLGYDYQENEIVFNSDGAVKGGTLKALVERLTMHDLHDSNFIATFLLTYRSFTSTQELFDLLQRRFLIEPPASLTAEELAVWREKKQTPVRLRVFNVMKNWLENYYQDDEDARCLPAMREFVATTMQEYSLPSAQLIKLIDKRMQSPDAGFRKMVLNVNNMQAPPSIVPKNLRKFKLLELDPLELARQLTLMDAKLYNKIRPVECLNKAWSNLDSADVAKNVKAMIEQSNQTTGWVAETILTQTEVKRRTGLIKHFVAIAEKCQQLNNFNTCVAIVAALDSSAVFRLRRTWELVNQRTQQTLQMLKRRMNSAKNFAEYRELLRVSEPPCVPFLGVYLTDLTFISDGNPDMLARSSDMINFAKRSKTAEVIREIQRYQTVPYVLNAVPEIQSFLKSCLHSSRPVEELYPLSLSLEPRERDDEKLARLLHESGFN